MMTYSRNGARLTRGTAVLWHNSVGRRRYGRVSDVHRSGIVTVRQAGGTFVSFANAELRLQTA